MSCDQLGAALEAVGVSDHVPEGGVVKHRLGDAGKRIALAHDIGAARPAAGAGAYRIIGLIEIGIGGGIGRAEPERARGRRRSGRALGKTCRIIGIVIAVILLVVVAVALPVVETCCVTWLLVLSV